MTDQSILDTLNCAILKLDQDCLIESANSTAESIFESSANTLVGKPFKSLFSRIEQSSILTHLQSPKSNRGLFTEHGATITLHNGSSLAVDFTFYPFNEESSNHTQLVEVRPLQRQVEMAREEQTHLQLLTSQQLARGLAHEIKNPLGGIRGAAQLLEREVNSPALKEYTDVIINEVDRLQALINNMLGPGQKFEPQPVNILEVLEYVRHLTLAAEAERIIIQRDYDPSIPEIKAVKDQLIQVFLNIVQNAVQAVKNNGVIIFKTRISRQVTFDKKLHPLVVKIDIIDDGPGVSQKLTDSIFMPMVTDKQEGSGLGLPIAQEIISRHGGTIRFERQNDQTLFSVYLPLELDK
jgi:two-component system, NtrC family, nitrogen regulation sensor histidine kinase GlnL